ncbi:MAG: PAS domain S-box protein, partial [Mariprofundaceae bacterium]|nr:PAS domain S-box protein [Mariprofundaceae bacterium]
MSRLRGFPWLPMRWILPLLLISVSGTVVLGFWWFEEQRSIADIEQTTVRDQHQDMHRLAIQLQLAIQHGRDADMQTLLSDFSSEPGLQYALILAPDGSISAASQLAWVGLQTEALAEPGLMQLLDRTLLDRRGHVHLSDDRMSLWAHYPLQYPADQDAIRSDSLGILIAKFDLNGKKQAAMYRIESWVKLFAVLVLLIAFLFWLISNYAITRRMNRLIAVARQVSGGDFTARSGLSGHDELAQIGAAFDVMTGQLDRESTRQRQLIRAMDNMSESVLITDAAGSIEYVNSAFTHITGYPADEAIGQNPRILKSGKHPPEFYAAFWARLSRGRIWKGRMTDRRKDGSLYLAKVSV